MVYHLPPFRGIAASVTAGISQDATFANMPAMNEALNTLGHAVLALPGDSTTMGVGALGAGSITNCIDNNKTHALRLELTAMGFTVTDDCFSLADKGWGTAMPAAYNGRLTFSAGWSLFNGYSSPWGYAVNYSQTAGATITMTPQVAIDTVEIFYRSVNGFGHFTINNGGTPVSVDTNNGGADSIGRTVVTLPLGTGDVVLTVTGDAGVVPLGARLYNSTTPRLVILDNLGNSSMTASGTGNSWTDTTNGNFSAFHGISVLACHGALIDLGLNDAYLGQSDAAFKAGLKSIVNKFKANTAPGIGMAPDVALEVPVDGQGQYSLGAKVQMVIDAASETSTRVPLNLTDLFPYSTYSTEFSDQAHPLKVLYDRIGAAEASWL